MCVNPSRNTSLPIGHVFQKDESLSVSILWDILRGLLANLNFSNISNQHELAYFKCERLYTKVQSVNQSFHYKKKVNYFFQTEVRTRLIKQPVFSDMFFIVISKIFLSEILTKTGKF